MSEDTNRDEHVGAAQSGKIEVDYVTLGEAAHRLDVPQPTLRSWVDKLEELSVHYLLRNKREERIFDANDINIFRFLKEMKDQHGRRATLADIGVLIREKFECRGGVTDLDLVKKRANLNEIDIEYMMDNERFMSKLQGFVNLSLQEMKEDVRSSLSDEMNEQMDQLRDNVGQTISELATKLNEIITEANEVQSNQYQQFVAASREEADMRSKIIAEQTKQMLDEKKIRQEIIDSLPFFVKWFVKK
ncbi:MerR family transcriptional regulator [Paenibacillus allorhizosphaerae]|uniref:HTH merR-type domain-containing protein n=1 Tax=Paenibacillus allorhizosphaerae TaxID=2849866 RepID=A0ABM8VUC8_9BACL|nr:MerR family transcriptional regulator [Paenibacillus allorhizosphaerae]CAG7658866.1 hypothetical protein PAECIP111802_07193 [Paenibacillus allorhizosphaerae]